MQHFGKLELGADRDDRLEKRLDAIGEQRDALDAFGDLSEKRPQVEAGKGRQRLGWDGSPRSGVHIRRLGQPTRSMVSVCPMGRRPVCGSPWP